MSINNRKAVDADLKGILALYCELQPLDPQLGDMRALQTFQTILHRPGLDIYVAERYESGDRSQVKLPGRETVGEQNSSEDRSGKIVGSIYLNVIPNLTRNASPYAVIENVIVSGHHRGQGIASGLMRFVLSEAWAAGCYKVMLQTGSKSASVHTFYKHLGFSAKTKTAYLARPQGEVE